MEKKILILLFIFLSINACSKEINLETVNIQVNGKNMEVYMAKNDKDRENGLMYIKKLKKDGMLFIYKNDIKMYFWMKNTLIPLSIAFISEKGEIKEIYNMESKSLETIESKHSVRYALEVKKGYFEKNSIKVKDIIKIPTINNIQ